MLLTLPSATIATTFVKFQVLETVKDHRYGALTISNNGNLVCLRGCLVKYEQVEVEYFDFRPTGMGQLSLVMPESIVGIGEVPYTYVGENAKKGIFNLIARKLGTRDQNASLEQVIASFPDLE